MNNSLINKNFTSIKDVEGKVQALVKDVLDLKKDPFKYSSLGKHKTLGLIFMNPSLRTRLSTQKAANNLGLSTMVMNIDKEGWVLEYDDDAIMNKQTVEHVKDAARVMGQYCDIIGIRTFAGLQNQSDDYSEKVLNKFKMHCGVPIISLESATLHPLQSLADMACIEENKNKEQPKVVLTWAPHIKALPQAVSNSFVEWSRTMNYDLTIAHPRGYELSEEVVQNTTVVYDQDEALKNADFVYVKNWSSYTDYGKVLPAEGDWLITNEKLKRSNAAKVMHCLPVRRGLELSHEVLDSDSSLVQEQALNRVFAAQAVLKNILTV